MPYRDRCTLDPTPALRFSFPTSEPGARGAAEVVARRSVRVSCRVPAGTAGAIRSVDPSKVNDLRKKIYVGNLPFDATADELREMFSPFGRVISAQLAIDPETGDSRGFAFVELAEGTEEAIQALHQAKFGGRTLTVNEAKPREERPRSGGYSRSR